VKRYRVYYNRMAEFPLLWSIDEGTVDTERKFVAVHMYSVEAETRVDVRVLHSDLTHPRVWLEVQGSLAVSSSVAIIRGTLKPAPLTMINGI
jgi:hypothetical protein